jgi:hypothetical protein
VALAVVLVLLTPLVISLERALTYPGSASWKLRLVEWTRDHGGAPVVNRVENWYYTRRRPGSGPPPVGSTVPAPSATVGRSVSASGRPAAVGPLVTPPSDGEGVWQPLGRIGAGHRPYIWATWFRPDPTDTSVAVAAAEIDQGRTSTELIAGTRDPGGIWPEGARVPPAGRPHLVAAFNAGFKFGDTRGGFASDGRTSKPLADGLATAVIDDHGRLVVERWSGGPALTPGLVAARQNLDLIVEGGRPVPGLRDSSGGRWGTDRNQRQFTWRSALGTTADGRLLYVAGDHLDLTTVAAALAHAGAVTGMQLDIHAALVSFNAFTPGPKGPAGQKLLAAMSRSADRYLIADQRDFFAVLAR